MRFPNGKNIMCRMSPIDLYGRGGLKIVYLEMARVVRFGTFVLVLRNILRMAFLAPKGEECPSQSS